MIIVICGGGIGGLVLAHALSKHSHIHTSVYEANPEFSGTGTGIGIFRRTWLILYDLGLGKAMENLCGAPSDEQELLVNVRDSHQATGRVIAEGYTLGGMRGAHRSQFHIILLEGLRKCTNVSLYTSKRATHYEQTDDRTVVHFADGTDALCDVLVGAEGLRSPLRKSMVDALSKSQPTRYQAPIGILRLVDGRITESTEATDYEAQPLTAYQGAIWSGFAVYRAVIPSERLKAKNADHSALSLPLVIYCGRDREIVAYPINGGAAVNVSMSIFDHAGAVARAPYPGKGIKNVTVAEVLRVFGSDWEAEVLDLFSCLEGLETNLWAVNEVEELPTYSNHHMALIGDAAHAMTPYLGMGAGQAIEDAYVLAAVLSHPLAPVHVEAALSAYSRIRWPFVADVTQLSRRTGLYCAHRDESGMLLALEPEVLVALEPSSAERSPKPEQKLSQYDGSARITKAEWGKRIAQGFEWQCESAEMQPKRAVEVFERMIMTS